MLIFLHLSFLNILPLTDQDPIILQDTVPTPLARTILYKIEGPISTLGCQSPTLAQLMSSHAVLDPILTRPASDKRKTPSLIASSTIKKKRTSKKLLIQVRIPCPPEHNAIPHSDHLLSLHDFRPKQSNQWLLQILPMLHQLVKFSPSYSLTIFFIGIHPLLASCRGNFGRSSYGKLFSSPGFSSSLTEN
jgi:hypothetical protein